MEMTKRTVVAAAALAALLTGTGGAAAADMIGGVEPSMRPEGAPVQAPLIRDADWYRQALTGINPPYPASLRFLEDEGRWYTPFNHPGMTGRYDIRGWHAQEVGHKGSSPKN